MDLKPHWTLFYFQKDFTVKGYKKLLILSFQIQIIYIKEFQKYEVRKC